jgi:hypothetical protein
MAGQYPGSIPAALKTMGRLLDDFNTGGTNLLYAGSTESKILPARAVGLLDQAQQELYDDLLVDGAEKTNLCRKITLVANSSDTQEFDLPPRVMQVYRLRDSNMDDAWDMDMHTPIASMGYIDVGWRVEQNNRRIRFTGITPDSNLTYYAWVLRRPPEISYGTVGAASAGGTTITLAATPTYGETMLRDDLYNGAEVAIVTASGTNAAVGTYQRITDYVASTRKATVGTAWTFGAADTYSIVFDLPEVAWPTIILRAAVDALPVYKKLGAEGAARLTARADRSYNSVLRLLRDPQPMAVLRPRIVTELLH